jgi:CheY-like chemotaxis protein
LDIFEPGDQTALVCVDVPAMQKLVVEQLSALGYKIHTGFSADDLLLKLRAHTYDLIIVSEHFGGSQCPKNPILAEAVHAPPARRHKQFLVLFGSSFVTNDELQAFFHSVDLVIGLADMVHLRPVLRRGLARTQDFYAAFNETLQTAGMA